MIYVLDASALLNYLDGGGGSEKLANIFFQVAESGKRLLMSTVNWGEVFYVLLRKCEMDEVDAYMSFIETLPIEIVDVDRSIVCQASLFKAQNKLPYADSVAAGLAKLRSVGLLTCDKDFKQVENDIKIIWI